MKRWIAKLVDGTIVGEDTRKPFPKWIDIKDKVTELYLDNDGQTISLPEGMDSYSFSKTACADLQSGVCNIESRNIAFELGNNKVIVRVEEKTNNIKIEVQ